MDFLEFWVEMRDFFVIFEAKSMSNNYERISGYCPAYYFCYCSQYNWLGYAGCSCNRFYTCLLGHYYRRRESQRKYTRPPLALILAVAEKHFRTVAVAPSVKTCGLAIELRSFLLCLTFFQHRCTIVPIVFVVAECGRPERAPLHFAGRFCGAEGAAIFPIHNIVAPRLLVRVGLSRRSLRSSPG